MEFVNSCLSPWGVFGLFIEMFISSLVYFIRLRSEIDIDWLQGNNEG